MSFWYNDHPGDRIACIGSEGRVWTYGDVRSRIGSWKRSLPQRSCKGLGLLLCQNSPESLVAYLAALQLQDAVILLDGNLAQSLAERIVQKYAPDWIFSATGNSRLPLYHPVSADRCLLLRDRVCERLIHSDLALLLSTSGSTGSPKLVRLSYGNVAANAASIAEYLSLNHEERPITSLPMSYAYGLSVINSHLLTGAAILLTDKSVAERDFWTFFCQHRASSFVGVPYTYQMLLRMGLLKSDNLASVRTLTQAGGRLDPRYIEEIHSIASQRGWRFFVMYGQTEATARISYVPPELLASRIGSIGKPIPGGTMTLDPSSGELIYRGPNVMLGYAEDESDLAKGDQLGGELHTGDVARRDQDGFFYIVGRMKRFVKIFGQRFNLDDIEAMLRQRTGNSVACVGSDDNLLVALERASDKTPVVEVLSGIYGLHQTAYRVLCIEPLPQTITGKIDYPALAESLGTRLAL
jgi:long-chain acyl-CoA synthetase